MSYVVQNDWKFDKERLKSELYRVLEDHGVMNTEMEAYMVLH